MTEKSLLTAIAALVVIAIIVSAGTLSYVMGLTGLAGLPGKIEELSSRTGELAKAEKDLAGVVADLGKAVGAYAERIAAIEKRIGAVEEATKPVPPLKIGFLCPRSGGYKFYGDHMVWATEVAVKEINAMGGILGRPVQVIFEDDEAKPEKGVLAAKKLILEDKVDFLMGVFSSAVVLAVAPVAAEHKKIFICTDAGTPDYTKLVLTDYAKNKYLFRTATNATAMSFAMVSCAMEMFKPKTYAFLATDYKFPRDVAAEMKTFFEKQGVKCLGEFFVSEGVVDFSPEVTKIIDLKPDILMNHIMAAHYHSFVESWWTRKPPIPLFCETVAWGTMLELVRELPERGDWLTAFTWIARAPITGKTLPFYDAYTKYTGTDVYGWGDVFSYDGMYVLKGAIERAGTIETEAVIKELEKTDYIGAGGRYVFTESHQARTSEKGYITGVVIQWWKGEKVVVWPKESATGTWRPYWT